MVRSTAATSTPTVKIAATLLSVVLVVASLYLAKSVLVPLALAILLTFVLSPIVTRLGLYGLPRVPAVLAVVGAVGLLLGALTWLVVSQLGSLAADLPNYRDNMRQKISAFRESTRSGVIEKVKQTIENVTEDAEKDADAEPRSQVAESSSDPANAIPVQVLNEKEDHTVFSSVSTAVVAISPALGSLATGGFVLVLVIFMLIHREDLRNRLLSFAENGSLTTTTNALDDAGQRISRYLMMQLIINGSFGMTVGLGLLLLGIPYAVLWGLCAAVFRYIPYIGPWVAAILPVGISIITSPGWSQVLFVVGLFLILELVSNNVMEPWLYGHGVGISVVALLVSAAFWTWIWGPIGLVLATPLTVCLAVLGKYVPGLAFLNRLLTDQPALKPQTAYLQRLLARDEVEAEAILRGFRESHSPNSMYDELLIPALILARHDRERGVMQAADESEILQATRTIIDAVQAGDDLTGVTPPPAGTGETVGDGEQSNSDALKMASEPPRNLVNVLGCPSHCEADELTLHMLGQMVRFEGLRVDVVSRRALASEIIERVRQEKPTAVIIAAIPPGGLIQARYLCKTLRKQFPDLEIIAGCWAYQGNLDRVIRKLRTAGAGHVTTTLSGARNHLLKLVPEAGNSPNQGEKTVALNRMPASLAIT